MGDLGNGGTAAEETANNGTAGEEQEQANEQGAAQETGQPSGDESLEQLTADRDKWKAMARKHEDRAKHNATAAQEWAKYQDSIKSEEEKTSDERNGLIKERDTALAQAAVLRAAVKHNLTEDDLELLEGLPAAVVEERAAKLAARVNRNSQPTPDPHLGRETPPGGQKTGDFLSNAFRR